MLRPGHIHWIFKKFPVEISRWVNTSDIVELAYKICLKRVWCMDRTLLHAENIGRSTSRPSVCTENTEGKITSSWLQQEKRAERLYITKAQSYIISNWMVKSFLGFSVPLLINRKQLLIKDTCMIIMNGRTHMYRSMTWIQAQIKGHLPFDLSSYLEFISQNYSPCSKIYRKSLKFS